MARLLVRAGCMVIALSMLSLVMSIPDGVTAGMPHDPIMINGDADFTAANGVTQGDGSETNPYVIEGWSIDVSSTTGIQVRDTTAYFEIRGVTVRDGSWLRTCILVANAAHVLVEDVTVSDAGSGVRIESCTSAVVKGITARFCINGVQLIWCDSCVILENDFQFNDRGVEIADSTNAMLFSNSFNNDGVEIVGFLGHDDTYNSHVIPSNNTVNGRPILCYKFQDGLNLDHLDAGQLIVLSCSDVKISDTAFSNCFAGITAALCEGIEVENCSFVDCGGVVFLSCLNVVVSYNTCIRADLFFAQSRNLLVHGNTIDDSNYVGIYLHNNWNVTASANSVVGTNLYYGILSSSDDVILKGNTLTRCGIETNLRLGNALTITPDNTVNGKPVLFYQGMNDVVVESVPVGQILLGSCNNVRVANVSISETHCGISARDVSNLTVFNTILSGNAIGLEAYECTNCSLLYSRLEGNIYDGAVFGGSTDCIVYGNYISGNGIGLNLWYSDGVKVFRNVFTKSTMHVADTGSSNVIWNGGYPEGGNYWSDYLGMDKYSGPYQDVPGSDGFGDTPYVVGQSGQDRYPFMRPPNITIPEPPPSADVNASIDFEPDTLNTKRLGRWVTVYIELPSGYDVEDIVIESVVLNGHIPATGPWEIGDFDKDKVQELMVKFDWRRALRLDDVTAMETMTMTISGVLKDGTAFQGSDDITILPSTHANSAPLSATGDIGSASVLTTIAIAAGIVLLAALLAESRRAKRPLSRP